MNFEDYYDILGAIPNEDKPPTNRTSNVCY